MSIVILFLPGIVQDVLVIVQQQIAIVLGATLAQPRSVNIHGITTLDTSCVLGLKLGPCELSCAFDLYYMFFHNHAFFP